MPDQTLKEHCKLCKNELCGNFCSKCGQPRKLKRINSSYIISEIGSVLNFEKGILYTIKELLKRPGKNIQTFISEDRNRLVKPIIFLIVCSLIYTVTQQILHFEDAYINFVGPEKSATTKIFIWIQSNYGNANILMAIIIAFWIKLLFRKYPYNLFEILILLCFLMGMGMLFYTVFGIIESLSGLSVLQIGGLIAFLYITWGIGQFFDKNKKINYLKGFLSYILGFLSFICIALGLGFFIDTFFY
jgi:hypothetical protein